MSVPDSTCAQYGYRAAIEEVDDADVDALFATNFFRAVSLIKAVLSRMREGRAGCIVNVSLIPAQRAMAGSGYYAATKSALELVSGALSREAGPLGMRVIVVDPGAFRTGLAGRSLTQSQTALADYEPGPLGAARAISSATQLKVS